MILSLLVSLVDQASVTIRFVPPVGQTIPYRMTMDMSQRAPHGPATAFRQETTNTLRIVSRKGGLTTLESRSSKPKVTFPPGSPMASLKAEMERGADGIQTRATIRSDGTVVSARVVDAGRGTPMQQQVARGLTQSLPGGIQGVVLPRTPVRIGQTWTVDFDMGRLVTAGFGGMAGGIVAKGRTPIQTRLVAVHRVGRASVAQLAYTMKGTVGITATGLAFDMRIVGSGTASVDLATGLVRDLKFVNDSTMTSAKGSMTQKSTITMRRL
jgi:hypothetical protein